MELASIVNVRDIYDDGEGRSIRKLGLKPTSKGSIASDKENVDIFCPLHWRRRPKHIFAYGNAVSGQQAQHDRSNNVPTAAEGCLLQLSNPSQTTYPQFYPIESLI